MENIKQTLLKGLLAVWCVGSLGTPILASSYVSWLGKQYGNIETSGKEKYINFSVYIKNYIFNINSHGDIKKIFNFLTI